MLLAASAALNPSLLGTVTVPWFSTLNYELLHWLFRLLPHNSARDNVAEALTRNPLVSTWVFGAALYFAWTSDGKLKPQRRIELLCVLVAFCIAVGVSLALRPWIAWPAPARSWAFRGLYPKYFWAMGSMNSFPSHSSLAYFLISFGFWPISRRISVLMSVLTLVGVSLPRMYVGGHYPVDIAISAALAMGTLLMVRSAVRPLSPWLAGWAAATGPGATLRELAVFFWIFEVGEGFSFGFDLLMTVLRLAGHFRLNF